MYETLLDPMIGLAMFSALNIGAVVVSMFFEDRLGKWSWIANVAVVLFLVCSPILMAFLVLATLPEDELGGPGAEGLILLPLLLEVFLLLIFYVLFLMRKIWRSAIRRKQALV